MLIGHEHIPWWRQKAFFINWGGSIETGVEFSVSDGNLDFRTDPNGFD